MNSTLRLLGLLLAGAAFGPPRLVQAQTPTLEFAPGVGNTTASGPVTTDQVITFQNNTDNPTANSFVAYAPTTTARFTLSNQQYMVANTQSRGVMFGGATNGGGVTGPAAYQLYPPMSIISGAASDNFTSTTGTTRAGIDVNTNHAVELFTDVAYLNNTANTRYQYADLTITFSQPMVNPVLHFVGLGSNDQTAANYTTELELLSTGVTLSKLSGSNELTVSATKILNTSPAPTTGTGNGAASGSVLVSTSSAGITSLQLRIFLRTAAVTTIASTNSTGDGWLLGISKLTPTAVSGYVFEDVNYGGGAGRPRSASGTAVRPGATVELYDNANNFVATTTTDVNGQYTFNVPAGTYKVRVVNSTVSSSRNTNNVANLLPVQTYNGTTTRVGGETPNFTDAPANSGNQTLTALSTGTVTPESIATIAAAGATTTGPDFGFNFDVIVNTNDAGQGSLRQFITNANALGGEGSLAQAGSYTSAVNLAAGSTAAGRAPVALPAGFESSIFMIPSTALTNGVAVITPTTALPQITGANTAINGSTQTFNIGNTNDVLLGAGGTVGTSNTALSQLNGPEVQLVGSTNVAIGLNVAGAGSRVRGLSIYGFGNATDDNANANIAMSANNIVIADNILGSTAASFAAVANGSANVRVASGTNDSFTNNLVGFAGGQGIYLATAVTGTSLVGNEIRGNARLNTALDGIDSRGSSTTATGNLFADNTAQGFDSFSSTGSNNVTGNTFTNNGIGTASSAPVETAAARFYGTGNTFSQNVSTSNYGAGVEVASGTTTITRNAIYNNGNVASANSTAASGQVGIDLVANAENANLGTTPFVTLNSATTTGANGLLNYPILRTANIVGTNLVLTGYAKTGAVIELFTAQANPAGVNTTGANFGQGRTFLTTLTEGVNDNDATTGQSYSGTINGINQGADNNANGFSFTIPLTSLPGGTLAAGTVLTSTATLNGATSEFSGNATAVTIAPLTGFVYEDVNYGGGAGRSRTTLAAAAIGRPGAKVELYNNAGALVGTAITDANGQYSFNAPVATGYTVRVVNNSVLSSRTGATAASGSATAGFVSNQLGVQTYNGTTSRVGGENPALIDAAANSGAQTLTALTSATNVPQSIATVSVGTGTTNAGPDFGFNFDVVVNTANAGQGSLAQFINNANALGGENLLAQAGSNNAGTLPAGVETSIFMIPSGAAVNGLLASNNGGPASQLNASGVAALSITSVLPTITGPNTSIDGTTQTINIGNTNNVPLGVGGTVGTNGTALGQLNGPEVQVRGTNAFNGITMATGTNNTTVRGLSLYGFNTNIFGGINNTGTRIEQNVIGASATLFADPGAGNRTLNEGVNLNDSDNGFVTNNLIGFNGGMGIWVLTGPGTAANGSNNNSITGNEIRGNALITNVGGGERLVFDGLELQGISTGNAVSGNLITANTGHGIDSYNGAAGAGGNTITGNTISNNGQGVVNGTGEEGSGLRIFGATNPTLIANNILSGNNGSGVLVLGLANQVTISQNSTSGNTRLGIDLLSSAETNLASSAAGTPFWNGNTGTTSNVTLNDNGDGDTGGNGLLNFPVLTTASVSGTSLIIRGFARPGSLVEFFLATPLTTDQTNSNRNFGQGSSYLTSFTEGSASDTDGGTGTYGANNAAINGVYQGTDATNQFAFTISLASLTQAQRTALLTGSAVLTSTATFNRSTSEFSGNLTLPITDVTVALTGPQTVSPGQPTGTYTATFTNEGPLTASTVTRTVTLPAGATSIFVNGVAYTPNAATPNVIDFGTAATLASGVRNAFSFSFTPATTATGTVAITGNITTATSQGFNVAPDASTISAPVVPVANVATTLAANAASVAAGTLATAGTPARFTATFSNNGASDAAGVVASVQLPVGLTNVSSTNNTGGVYSPTTGILTYPNLTAIAVGGSTTSVITFDAPATGPVAATSTISTTTSEAGQTANNQASATIAITPAFDLTTSISGPASAVTGDLVTLNVTTTNNGPAAAANAVQTVQLATGLTNVYVSNGGVYNPQTTTQTIIANGVSYSVPGGGVIFPTLASLATGQTVANSISFSMGAAFAPSALVTPNTASTATTAGDTNTGNNTANLNAGADGTNLTVATPATGTANAYTTIRTSAATTTVGAPVTLTVTTGNNGPNQATGVTQTVQILPGFTTGTLQVNGVTGGAPVNNVITFGTGGPTYNTTTGVVTFPSLTNGANGSASGTSVTNTITLTPSAAVANTSVATTGNNGQLLAMATVRTTNTDPVAADNVASVGITLAPASDLVTSITGPASALAGQSVTYTASFTNNGPLAASGVTETAQLPAGLSAVSITNADNSVVTGASYNATTGLVTFPGLLTDANGATQVFKLTFAAPAQSFTPRSSVGSTSSESNPANNNASVATSVAASADLATLVSGPATAVIGTAVTYTVTTTNNGPLAATNASTTLQLAAGFDATTLRVNGTTGVLNGTTITYTFGAGATATTATYSTTSGLVTFPAIASLTNGTSASNYVTFVMPNAAGGQTAGVASTTATGNTDPIASNNSASVATSIAPTTTTSADLVATVSASAATVGAGGSVTYTATYSNIGTDPGVNVLPTLQLLPGLTTATLPLINGGTGTLTNGNITFSNSASYNQQSGVLTFPPIASQATGTAGTVSYNVQVIAPNNGPLLATAVTTSNTSEPNTTAAQNNNVQSVPVNITPLFNEVTSISGPATAVAGTSQTYTVTTTNNGPSATSNATTQTVTVPAGQTPTNITNSGVYANNSITWTIPAGQPAGVNGAVANSFTIVQPTASTTLTATVTVTGESNSGDNTATITTSPTNLAPLAYAVVNTLQNPQSNEAGGLATGLLISPLNASDPENAFATQKYTIVAAPSAAQGTLYYLNNGTYTAVPLNPATPLTLTDAQAQTLRFKAATGYVGNASFTYLTTDAAGNLSPAVNYTIPVETDVDAVAYTPTPTKGGANPYVAGDVIAYTTDANSAVYNATTSSVYQANGTLQPTVAGSAAPTNGITAANAVAGSITGPNTTTATTLADIGLAVDATGRLVVAAAPNTSKLKAGSYSVQILTTDANGGQTSSLVSFTIPAFPLPVVLTAFTASAVANRDAQLNWNTASEVNSAAFEVERSLDGTTFSKVGLLAAKGTTAAPSAYAFLDKGVASLATGTVYYRLKQVDLDGKFAYSPVRTVAFTKAALASLSLYPNPAQTATKLDLASLPATATYQVTLLDVTGRAVRSLTLGGGAVQTLEISTLASGTYYVLVTGNQADGSPLHQSLRLTKE
jgi:uncharacterized repeat protein (TIGR01451 family)